MPTLFLDANILFSAAYRGRSFLLLWEEAKVGFSKLRSSQYAIVEAKRNLEKKKADALPILQELLKDVTVVPEPALHWQPTVTLPKKDWPILGAALMSRCDFLITGDRRDFGPLLGSKIQELQIVTLRQYLYDYLKESH